MEAACIPAPSQGFRERAEAIVQQVHALGDGYVKISSPGIDWFIYGKDGRIVYLSNSIEPFERLSRVLRGCLQHHAIDGQALSLQIRGQFEQVSSTVNAASPQADYQVLAWMINNDHISSDLLDELLHQLNLEVMESLCQLPQAGTSQHTVTLNNLHPFSPIDFQNLYQEAETRLKQWQGFQPELFSPYQRPYFSGVPLSQSSLPPDFQTRLRQILIGFSWRQIAMLMNQDELSLAKQLLPLIRQDIIRLRDPFSPFDQLPWQRYPTAKADDPLDSLQAGTSTPVASSSDAVLSHSSSTQSGSATAIASSGESGSNSAPVAKTWQVVCIDDSPAVLNEINRCLGTDMFSVTLIEDSKKALMKINSIKPDIILLDANMPGVDGYQVCTMLRKSNKLKHIPVIMVTGNRGLVNRAKAKMAGITDYLNKPFSQKELLEIVFRHLSD